VKEGAVVALPNDPTNAARALVVLEQLRLDQAARRLRPDPRLRERRGGQPQEIKLTPIEAAQLPRSLDDTDYSFATATSRRPPAEADRSARARENQPNHQNWWRAQRRQDKPWFQGHLRDAYRSREFPRGHREAVRRFVKTDYQQALTAAGTK